ncbi:EH domain-containing protein 4 [Grus japonensis]|uniref:EH domain-containing protein 4 n=1 Tax=Grus japonensis TaxID=30415 RepID=A0ABC9X7T7_GRUJA
MEKTMVRQAVPLQPMEGDGGADIHLQAMEDNGGADIHLQPMEDPMLEQVDAQRRLWPYGKPTLEQALGRTRGPVVRGAHARAGLLAGLVTPWGDPCWSSLFLKVCTPWESPTLEQF